MKKAVMISLAALAVATAVAGCVRFWNRTNNSVSYSG